jgi:hypothetical protein
MEQPLHGRDQPPDCLFMIRAEEIGPLDRREGPAGAQRKVRHRAVVQADRYQPRVIRAALAQLLNGQHQLLVLITPPAGRAMAGKAGDEDQRVTSNRLADPGPPVLPRPQVSRIAPHADPSCLECSLQGVDLSCVLPDVRDEGVPRPGNPKDPCGDGGAPLLAGPAG